MGKIEGLQKEIDKIDRVAKEELIEKLYKEE